MQIKNYLNAFHGPTTNVAEVMAMLLDSRKVKHQGAEGVIVQGDSLCSPMDIH